MSEVFDLPLVKLYTGRLRAPIFGSLSCRNNPYLVTHLDHGKGMFINELTNDCAHTAHQTCFGLPLHAPLVSPSTVNRFLFIPNFVTIHLSCTVKLSYMFIPYEVSLPCQSEAVLLS